MQGAENKGLLALYVKSLFFKQSDANAKDPSWKAAGEHILSLNIPLPWHPEGTLHARPVLCGGGALLNAFVPHKASPSSNTRQVHLNAWQGLRNRYQRVGEDSSRFLKSSS